MGPAPDMADVGVTRVDDGEEEGHVRVEAPALMGGQEATAYP